MQAMWSAHDHYLEATSAPLCPSTALAVHARARACLLTGGLSDVGLVAADGHRVAREYEVALNPLGTCARTSVIREGGATKGQAAFGALSTSMVTFRNVCGVAHAADAPKAGAQQADLLLT